MVVPRHEIAQLVRRLARQIDRDYPDHNPLLLGVLKGSFVFLADLVRRLTIPLEIDFIQLASYGPRLQSTGQVRLVHTSTTPLLHRHVLLVEDLIDRGYTARSAKDWCAGQGAASVRLCALFVKGSAADFPALVDYWGATIPELFVVGYGIDAQERYRSLPDLRALEGNGPSGREVSP